MTWARKYIGSTPKDCWAFVREIYQAELDVFLPEYAGIMIGDIGKIAKTMELASESSTWNRINHPIDFTVVAMSKGKAIHHVGVYTSADRGKVVHSLEGTAVVANDWNQLKKVGFQRIEYYELSSSASF